MVKNEFTFPSADGKTDIHAVEWLPDIPARAVLQLSHGVSEYILRYAPLAEFLTARGLIVAGHDHLGHGASVAPGAPRLYFGPKGSWSWVVEDLARRRELVRERWPELPCFLLGHSMGSFLARTFLIRFPGAVDGAILMGTGQMRPALIAAGKAVAAAEALRVGEERGSPLVEKLAFGVYNRQFAPNRTAFDWISRNPENVDRYLEDPLCGENPSTGLFREMLSGLSEITDSGALSRMDPETPVLFISGDKDPVGESGAGVKRAYISFQRAGVRDVRLLLYPELRHEILNEREADTVCQDLYAWLEARLPVPAAV